MKIEILGSAQRDLLDGYWFYEKQASGLGAYFLQHLKAEIDALADTAGIHRRIRGQYHWIVSKKFPHAVYYHVQNETAYVDAVIDCRRSPHWIRKRLD